MSSSLEWKPGALIRQVERGLSKGLDKGSAYLQTGFEVMLNVPGVAPREHEAQNKKKGRKYGLLPATGERSKPGEPPRYELRELLASIHTKKEGRFKRLVGTPYAYGVWLEFGTRNNLAPRPWLRPGWEKYKGKVAFLILQEARF